jgi:hypothetical protein
MNNTERIANLAETKYLELFGIRKPTFEVMLAILNRANEETHKQGGRPSRLSVLDKLVIMRAITMIAVPGLTSRSTTTYRKAGFAMP